MSREEVFVAAEDDLAFLLTVGVPADDSMALELAPLVALGVQLLGVPAEQVVADFGDPVADGGEQGPWIVSFPERFAHGLMLFSDDEARAVAVQWHRSWAKESRAREDHEGQAFVERMTRLRDLARRAEDSRRGLFFWASV